MNLLFNDGIKWGKDAIFTYGPLGFLFEPKPMYINAIISMIFWSMIFILACFIFWYMLFSKDTEKFHKRKYNVFASLVMFYIGSCIFKPLTPEYIYSFINLSLIVLCYRTEKIKFFVIASIMSVAAMFLKFNLAVTCFLLLMIFTFTTFIDGNKNKIKYFVIICLIPIVSCICYLIYNPSIDELLYYVKGALDISSGYNYAMSITANDFGLINRIFTLMYLSLMTIILFLFLKIFSVTKAKHKLNYALIFLVPVFFLYKHAFVRMGVDRNFVPLMYIYVSLYIFFMDDEIKFSHLTSRLMKVFICVFFCMSLIISGLGIENDTSEQFINKALYFSRINSEMGAKIKRYFTPLTTKFITNPVIDSVRKIINAYDLMNSPEKYDQREFKTPAKFIDRVRTRKTTIYPWEISHAQDFLDTYSTMPEPQAYSAYTTWLDQQNANYFADNTNAPYYVIFNTDAIDNRFPLIECPLTWLEIFKNYRITDTDKLIINNEEKTEFLLERTTPKNFKINEISSKHYSRDETITIPSTNKYCLMKLDMKLSILGQAAKFLWKIPAVHMEAEFIDGEKITKRIIPDVMKNDTLISSLVLDEDSFAEIMNDNLSINRVKSIKFSGDGLKFYNATITITFSELDY